MQQRSGSAALKQFLSLTLAGNDQLNALLDAAEDVLALLDNNNITVNEQRSVIASGDMVGFILSTDADSYNLLQQRYAEQ